MMIRRACLVQSASFNPRQLPGNLSGGELNGVPGLTLPDQYFML